MSPHHIMLSKITFYCSGKIRSSKNKPSYLFILLVWIWILYFLGHVFWQFREGWIIQCFLEKCTQLAIAISLHVGCIHPCTHCTSLFYSVRAISWLWTIEFYCPTCRDYEDSEGCQSLHVVFDLCRTCAGTLVTAQLT